MALFNIPIDTSKKFQELNVSLGDSSYKITLGYNQRVENWYFSMTNEEDEIVISNKPLVLGADLLSFADSSIKPDGILFVYSLVDRLSIPDGETFGINFLLAYGEVEA
jgi:hypothetical protein